MAIILTPILKNTANRPSEPGTKSQRVSFVVPGEDIESVIKYLQEDAESSYQTKQNNVIKVILSPQTQELVLANWLTEFKDNIFALDKENERVACALLKINWADKDDSFMALYQELILNLVSAHPFYLRLVFSIIIKTFYSESEEKCITDEARNFERAHDLLKNIIKIVPSSPILLCTMLSDKFPYMKRPSHIFESYLQNVLKICSYLEPQRPVLLGCIIDKLLHMDVYCNKEIIEQFEVDKEEQENIFLMEQEGDGGADSEEKPECMAYPLAHTLDIQMDCLFNFIKATCYSKGGDKLNWEATKKLYKELLKIFDKTILPTYGSCHVQFIMFYICSSKPELCEGFLDYLWKKVQNPSVAPVVRQISAFYIGSLLSRATYVSISTVTACFDLMCQWIHCYIDAQDVNSCRDVRIHGTFHSVCQAVFYIFAFRHKELINMKNSHRYLRSLNFDRIVTCRLNPLKFCQRPVVQNFANVARNYQIAYCYPVIEKNNRNLASCLMESTSECLSGAMVDSFFPFDPYLLKRSKPWVEPFYRIYDAHREDIDESMEEEEPAQDLEIPACNTTLFSYGASPGFKKSHLKSPKIR